MRLLNKCSGVKTSRTENRNNSGTLNCILLVYLLLLVSKMYLICQRTFLIFLAVFIILLSDVMTSVQKLIKGLAGLTLATFMLTAFS